MELYPASAYQGSRGVKAITGPNRGATKDPYANYPAMAAPAASPAGQIAPVIPPETLRFPPPSTQPNSSAARQLKAQQAASRQMEERLEAEKKAFLNGAQAGTPPGTQAGTNLAPAAQVAARGFALSPEDSWLSRLGFCADNWMDCDPSMRVRYLQNVGCPTNQLNVVANALTAWCSRRTGR